MNRPCTLLGFALCTALCAAIVSIAGSEELELLTPQVYDLGQEAAPPKKAPKPAPSKPAPQPEVDKFVPSPSPPPRAEAPPVAPQPRPQLPPGQDDDHYIQQDDFFVQHHGLDNRTWIWVELAKMVVAPSGNTKGEAEFMKIKDGRNYWTSHYWRTRIAEQGELRLGLQVIAFNDNHANGVYNAPLKKDRARGGGWFLARITDMSDLYKGFVTVSGNYKVSLRNLRIIIR